MKNLQWSSISNAKSIFQKKKKTEIKERFHRSTDENTKRPMGSRNSKGNFQGNPRQNVEVKEMTDYEGEVLQKLSETFNAGLANRQRMLILDYCLIERSFSDIMLTLRLNPASLKHHGDLLQVNGLIEKTGEGKETRYRTTKLGKMLLGFLGDVLKAVRAT